MPSASVQPSTQLRIFLNRFSVKPSFYFFFTSVALEWWLLMEFIHSFCKYGVNDGPLPLAQIHSGWSCHSAFPDSLIAGSQFPETSEGNPDSPCFSPRRGLNTVFCRQPGFLLLKKLSFLAHRFWRWWYRQPVDRVRNIQMFHPLPITGVFWIVKLQWRCRGTEEERLSSRLTILHCVKVIFSDWQ